MAEVCGVEPPQPHLRCAIGPIGSSAFCTSDSKGYTGYDAWDITDTDFDKLDKESEKLEEQLRAAKDQKISVRAKIKRLKSQKEFLKGRRHELIRRGLNNIEEMEKTEAAERSNGSDLPLSPASESMMLDQDSFHFSESDITAMLQFGAAGTSLIASPN